MNVLWILPLKIVFIFFFSDELVFSPSCMILICALQRTRKQLQSTRNLLSAMVIWPMLGR